MDINSKAPEKDSVFKTALIVASMIIVPYLIHCANKANDQVDAANEAIRVYDYNYKPMTRVESELLGKRLQEHELCTLGIYAKYGRNPGYDPEHYAKDCPPKPYERESRPSQRGFFWWFKLYLFNPNL